MVESVTKRPTLKTIAELSGLAIPTVSRALNDAPDIGEKTKARVRSIAKDIGYVPDRTGLRLRTGKTNVISLVMGAENAVTDHTGQMISSIAKALRDTQYHLNITPYFPNEDPMIPVRYIVETQSADAVILNRIETEDPRVAYLMERKFPFAAHGRTKWKEVHPYFDFDNTTFGALACQKLVAAGRSHILLMPPPIKQNYARDMIEGATASAAQLGVALQVLRDVNGDDATQVIEQRIADHLAQTPQADALICPSATAAMAGTVACEKVGRRLGADIDLFAKEALPFLHSFRPSIMTVRENVIHAGEFLARAAIQAIEHPGAPPLQELSRATET